jgi:hypothetical protein
MDPKQPILDEWQEETIKVPTLDFDVETDDNGDPIRITPKIVEKEVKQRYRLATMTNLRTCAAGQHYFMIDHGGRRIRGRVEVKCTKCDYGQNFVVGVHKLVNGKIISGVNNL